MSSVTGLVHRSTSPKQLLSAADRSRDAKDWSSAINYYQAYLETTPSDAGIWVQYGHSLKEHGALLEAEQAYRRAAELDLADADSRLHLAHLLKRLDRPRQAAATFREVMELSPTAEVVTELQSLGFGVEAHSTIEHQSVKRAPLGCCLELKDLFQYLSLHTTVTGITRVTLGLVNFLLETMDEAEAASYQFVHQFGDAEGVLLISKPHMRRVVKLAMSDTPDLPTMQTLIGEIRATSPVTRLQQGDVYLIVGAFWEFVANPSWIGGMKSQGVLIGAYIYDLIPITHAHYCMSALTEAFTAAFAETARLLDFAFTISEFVAKQVTSYVAQHGIASFPTIAVPLAHELRFTGGPARRREPVSSVLDEFDGVPFVVCICTIEARKNHAYLFYIWQRMIDAGIDVPDLVFVGRPGWRIQDLLDQIAASRNLGGRLHILHGLSDEDLEALYERCLFTVFPSFVEGWGLPVGESLAHGKVCVASSTSSITEVGGDFAVYVDPFNLEDGYKTISGLISNPSAVAELEAKLRKSFTPRTWTDVGADFFAKVARVRSSIEHRQTKPPLYAPSLPAGRMLDVRTMDNVGSRGGAYVANPERLAFADGWRGIEATGTWMRTQTAKVRVLTDCGPGQSVHVLVHIGTSPWVSHQNTMHLSATQEVPKRREQTEYSYARPMPTNADRWIKLKGMTDEAGYLTVHFRVDGTANTPDPSYVAVALRLHAFGYAAAGDAEARLDLLEQALLFSQS